MQGIFPILAAHLQRRLQSGAARRPLGLAEQAAQQVAVEMPAGLARRLVQAGNRRRDAAGGAAGTAGVRRPADFSHAQTCR